MNCPHCNFHVQNYNVEIYTKYLLYQYRVRHVAKNKIKQTKSISDANNSWTMSIVFVINHFQCVLMEIWYKHNAFGSVDRTNILCTSLLILSDTSSWGCTSCTGTCIFKSFTATRAFCKIFPCDSILYIFECDGAPIRGNLTMHSLRILREMCFVKPIPIYDTLILLVKRYRRQLVVTRQHVRRVRMTRSTECALYLLFSSRRISDHLENASCRLGLVLVGSEFWELFLHACSKCRHL